jgi:hypothetical protein
MSIRNHSRTLVAAGLCLCALTANTLAASPLEQPAAPQHVARGEMIAYPGPWGFLRRGSIILVSDQELETLANSPDEPINLATTFTPRKESLRQVCDRLQAGGVRTLIVAFDHFFRQYRPGQDQPRQLMPDMPEYIELMAKIARFARQYDIGLELSLLSPLEIGPAYVRATDESGVWMHYRKGLRDPQTGQYSVQLWRQRRWSNNKGPIDVRDGGVRVFAFSEKPLAGTPYRVVPPESIVEITESAEVEIWPATTTGVAQRVRVHGNGSTDLGKNLNRVLVVQQYQTPEMDYFSDRAPPFLKQLVDRYADAGIQLHGLYSDEMHIQQDWGYFKHHDHGEFALRYVSPGLADKFAQRYGSEYADFAKYMIYFARGQEDFAHDLSAKQGIMHVMGATPLAVRQTALLRARYYQMLQNGVVDLFVEAKRHAEQKMGRRLESRAHATWAESPTIDRWNTGRQPQARNQYEYTSNFLWSCTVHQAASACYDYFKWGDFLTGNGSDHAEGGWIDRNYFALALSCSIGILNEVPYAYSAHWGMPSEIRQRRTNLVNAFGASAHPAWAAVQDAQHRDVDVLMLYPLDLVAVDERFGSWMTQYGYANYVTRSKLIERGQVRSGAIELAGRRFTTLVALFEPFPSSKLLEMMQQLTAEGGKVVWSGPPPLVTWEGTDAFAAWQRLFGVDHRFDFDEGLLAPGRTIQFHGLFEGVGPQTVLTDFLVDRIYNVTPHDGTQTVATAQDHVVAAVRTTEGGGTATFLGYRPRDDQSKSLGYETRNWFEILLKLRAYPGTGRFSGINDNTEYVSRTSPYLTCRFPNGSIAIAPHFRHVEEGWPGGFARNPEEDKRYMASHPLAPDTLELSDFQVNGHTIEFAGRQGVTFRLDDSGNLIGFAGSHCDRITIDGREHVFADRRLALVSWAPVPAQRQVPGGGLVQIRVHGAGTVRIPRIGLPESVKVVAEGKLRGSRGHDVQSRVEENTLVVEITGRESGRWLWACAE